MRNPRTTLLAAAALAASLTSVAAAAQTRPMPSMAHRAQESTTVGISRIVAPAPKAARTDESGIDRTFRPDYTHALTVDQMSAAWEAESDRVFETPITGGG